MAHTNKLPTNNNHVKKNAEADLLNNPFLFIYLFSVRKRKLKIR